VLSKIRLDSLEVPELLVSQNTVLGDTSNDDTGIHPERVSRIQHSNNKPSDSEDDTFSTPEEDILNEVIENWEGFIRQSKHERKAIGRKN